MNPVPLSTKMNSIYSMMHDYDRLPGQDVFDSKRKDIFKVQSAVNTANILSAQQQSAIPPTYQFNNGVSGNNDAKISAAMTNGAKTQHHLPTAMIMERTFRSTVK